MISGVRRFHNPREFLQFLLSMHQRARGVSVSEKFVFLCRLFLSLLSCLYLIKESFFLFFPFVSLFRTMSARAIPKTGRRATPVVHNENSIRPLGGDFPNHVSKSMETYISRCATKGEAFS